MSRILCVITQSEIGGAQRYLLELAPYLASRGHEIIVAAGEGGGELFDKLQIPKAYYIKNLVRGLNPLKDILALFTLLKVIRNEKPDVLFLQSTKAGFLGSLAAKFTAIPHTHPPIRVIYRIGGWSFRDPRPWHMNQILFWMEKLSAPLKDVIIVNSELDRQIAIDRKIAPTEKIAKIYNGIDPEKLNFLPREEARKSIIGIGYRVWGIEETIIVGAIANLYATKGIEYLIEAVHLLPSILHTPYSIQFVVIGEGKERPRLESLIKRYNLGGKFFLIGRIPNASEYLKAFDIFVLPSVKEGFPWVLLEAMAAQVPIIATRVGAVPEVVEDGKDGLLVPPKDSKEKKEKILQLISVPYTHDREQMVVNAQEKLKKFTLKKMLEESESVITLFSHGPN